MKFFLCILLLCAATALSVYFRRRFRYPCPWYMSFLLENPITESIMGSSKLLDRLDVHPGMRVLDVGCGPGRLTVPASKRVGPSGEVAALDLQQGMLKKLERKLKRQGITNVRTILGGIGQGSVESNSFDRAILVTVLGEISDPVSAMKAIFDALKPGGVLSVTEAIPDPDYQAPGTVRRLAKGAGFRIDREFGNWFAFTINFIKPSDG